MANDTIVIDSLANDTSPCHSVINQLIDMGKTFQVIHTPISTTGPDLIKLCDAKVNRVYLGVTSLVSLPLTLKVMDHANLLSMAAILAGGVLIEYYIEKHKLLQSLEYWADCSGITDFLVTEVIYIGG